MFHGESESKCTPSAVIFGGVSDGRVTAAQELHGPGDRGFPETVRPLVDLSAEV